MKYYRRYGLRALPLWVLENVYDLIEGDHEWAERRSLFLTICVVILFLMGWATEHIELTDWGRLAPYLETLPRPFLFLLSFVHPQSLRHLLPPLAAVTLAISLAANYLRDLFELPDLGAARWYLTAAMFGREYPFIRLKSTGYEIDESDALIELRKVTLEEHPLPKIGGPGYVRIMPGNVAIFEHVGGPSKVVGAGRHFIRRFETLREVTDLRDQIRTRDEVKALTKDGIPVTAQNVQVSFRVRTSNRARTQKEIYPFSVAAVKSIAYGKSVGVKGPLPWTDRVPMMVATNIRNYISRTRLDDLIARREGESKDPREKIKAMFEHKDTRKRFNDLGVDLLWVSLGHLKTPRDVLDERIAAWQAEWERQRETTLSEAEAHRLRLTEFAKAMARLELVENSLKGLPLNAENAPTFERIIIHLVEGLTSMGRQTGAVMSFGEMREMLYYASEYTALQQLSSGQEPAGDRIITDSDQKALPPSKES